MKKLLSILAVSGIIATIAPTAIACETSTTPPITNKQDLIIDNIKIYIGNNIYDDVRTDLASQIGGEITADNIKNDNAIVIQIFLKDSTDLLPETTISTIASIYTLKISISEEDAYFNPTDGELTKDISITIIKKDLNIDNIVLYIGNNIYNDVRDELALQIGGETTSEDIKNDNLIVIQIFLKDSTDVLPEDTLSIVSTTYTVKINIEQDDIYFNSTNGELTKDISTNNSKADLNMDTLDLHVGVSLRNDICIDLALQISANTTLADISADNLIDVKVYDGTTLMGLAAPSSAGITYTVKIIISDGDPYFNPTNGEESKDIVPIASL